MSVLPNSDDHNDSLRKILLPENVSTKCEILEDTSKISNTNLNDNSASSITDQSYVLQELCQSKDDFMECNIEHCNILNLNKQIVSSLLDLKQHVTFALQECEHKLTAIDKSLQTHAAGKVKVFICNAGMPYFKDRQYFFASNNEDEILQRYHKELQLRNLPKVTLWRKKERDILLRAVKEEAASTKNDDTCTKHNNTMLKLKAKIERKHKAKTSVTVARIVEMIDTVQKKELDWFKISSIYFENLHSPLDCSVMWNVFLHPKINKNSWPKSEDAKLKKIAEKYEFQNWDKIAEELSTNRTAYQCFIRHNTTKKLPNIRNCTWESEEDEKLLKLIEIFRIGDFIPWGEVANWMKNRIKQQIYFRWTYSLAPYLIKGRFTKIEDNILKDAVTKYGTNFHKISAALMPNRSTIQLHDRYQTLTTKQMKNWNLWTLEEDTKLLDLYRCVGPNWSMIAKDFSCKTRTQLRHRHTALQKYFKRGVSLFELHINEIEQMKLEYNYIVKANISTNDIDRKLIEYFCSEYKTGKSIHNRKPYTLERLKCNTMNLYKILKLLHAKLFIGNDKSNVKLSDRDWQLSYSLRDYIKMKSDEKLHSEIIIKYQLQMFGRNEIREDGSHFVPPPPFGIKIKSKTTQQSQHIDYNLDTKNNFLLELPKGFDTPDFVTSYIGGDEQELQFQKLSKFFQTLDIKDKQSSNNQKCFVLSIKQHVLNKHIVDRNVSSVKISETMQLPAHSNIGVAAFKGDDKNGSRHIKVIHRNRQNKPNMQTSEQRNTSFNEINKKYSLSASDTGEIQKPTICATHANLQSLKNLMYLKQLNERYSTQDQSFVQSNKFQKTLELLEIRLKRLLKYPIGLSKIALPEVHEMDTFSFNDIISETKPFEILDVLLEEDKIEKSTIVKPEY